MSSRACTLLLIGVAAALLACSAGPPSFRMIELAEAQRLAAAHELILVEVARANPGAPGEPSPGVPGRVGVLVFGDDVGLTQTRAAALARAGNHPVLVFVPRDAEERGRFYAVASPAEEDRRGEDS